MQHPVDVSPIAGRIVDDLANRLRSSCDGGNNGLKFFVLWATSANAKYPQRCVEGRQGLGVCILRHEIPQRRTRWLLLL